MLNAINTLAAALGYVCLLIVAGWLVGRFMNQKRGTASLPLSDEAPPRNQLLGLRRRLEEKEPQFAGWGFLPTRNRKYEIYLEKRTDSIDCFIEDISTRSNGEGTGEFIHLPFSHDEIRPVAEWMQITQEDHWESMRKDHEEGYPVSFS